MTDYNFGGVIVTAPPPWEDFTDEVDAADKPFTLARPSLDDGVVLQFSPMLYRSGQAPALRGPALLSLAKEMGEQRGLAAFDEVSQDGPLSWGACSYHAEEDFVRAWYVCDGQNVALVTFLCPRASLDSEVLRQAAQMVEGLRFAAVSDRRAA